VKEKQGMAAIVFAMIAVDSISNTNNFISNPCAKKTFLRFLLCALESLAKQGLL
jgi:hypothetical protein